MKNKIKRIDEDQTIPRSKYSDSTIYFKNISEGDRSEGVEEGFIFLTKRINEIIGIYRKQDGKNTSYKTGIID